MFALQSLITYLLITFVCGQQFNNENKQNASTDAYQKFVAAISKIAGMPCITTLKNQGCGTNATNIPNAESVCCTLGKGFACWKSLMSGSICDQTTKDDFSKIMDEVNNQYKDDFCKGQDMCNSNLTVKN